LIARIPSFPINGHDTGTTDERGITHRLEGSQRITVRLIDTETGSAEMQLNFCEVSG